MSGGDKPGLDREALRAMVRQVLRDALPDTVKEKLAAAGAKAAGKSSESIPASARPAPKARARASAAAAAVERTETVSLDSNAELAAFVRRLVTAAAEPRQREAILAGRVKFLLREPRAEAAKPAGGGVERIDKGLVTERKLIAAAKAGRKLIVARGVVLTPLARDKARQLGVQIERE
jgi:hypothetical protein